MVGMELTRELIRHDPAAPRLTIYNDRAGTRLDFSAQTLDNWAAKVGNMLYEELDADQDTTVVICLPVQWQTVTVALGCYAAAVQWDVVPYTAAATTAQEVLAGEPDIVFCPVQLARELLEADFAGDIAVVTEDPFGRGAGELGEDVPDGAIDFGPTVRFFGDDFPYTTPTLRAAVAADGAAPAASTPLPPHDAPGANPRCLTVGWTDKTSLLQRVLLPLANLGSVVVVAHPVTAERLQAIATAERVSPAAIF